MQPAGLPAGWRPGDVVGGSNLLVRIFLLSIVLGAATPENLRDAVRGLIEVVEG